MAIFNPTIFNDITGSVGNVTSYKVDGKQIARGKPLVTKDPKTPEQLKQRAKMRVITKLRRGFIKALEVGYCSTSRKFCANCFTRDNIHKVNAEDLDNPTVELLSLSLSGNELRLPLMEAEINREERLIVFRWKSQPLMPFMLKDDRIMGIVYEREEKKNRLVELGTRGVNGEMEWSIPEDWDVNKLIVYGFAISKKGDKASGTLGLLDSGKKSHLLPDKSE